MNFSAKTPVKLVYKNKVYNSEIQYSNSILYASVFTEDEDILVFCVDNTSCSVEFKGLSQEFLLTSLEKDFMPVALYEFFLCVGSDFKTELYDESSGICSLTRDFGGVKVTLEALQKESIIEYTIEIN